MFELPSDYIAPLIDQNRQIPVTLHPFAKSRVHNRLRSWPNCDFLLQFWVSVLGHPSYFWGESLYVTFFGSEGSFADKEGEVGVLDAQFFDPAIESWLDFLPNWEGPGTENVATGNIIIFNEFSFDNYLWVPIGKVICLLNSDLQLSFLLLSFDFLMLLLHFLLFFLLLFLHILHT